MPTVTFAPGFRFHPTDVELVCYYLKRKVLGKPLHFNAISEIELYKFAPWDLPDQSCLKSKDLVWYFFCLGGKKYSNGRRKNRMTDVGYWKTTGKDSSIMHDSRVVAMKKTLVFHSGQVQGQRTDWVMYEYKLEDSELAAAGVPQDDYVLCKVFQKRGKGPKKEDDHGASFREEEWENYFPIPPPEEAVVSDLIQQPNQPPVLPDSISDISSQADAVSFDVIQQPDQNLLLPDSASDISTQFLSVFHSQPPLVCESKHLSHNELNPANEVLPEGPVEGDFLEMIDLLFSDEGLTDAFPSVDCPAGGEIGWGSQVYYSDSLMF